ncbi:GNAT family N-acetyltransferase [Jidongwangia harbinensis]|uniref:GNAT family N-acetyltransferase n=1 Tax=Jidongwangia harbinensis TaxID=2878561 RepID=UPI001CD98A40|nr:GNAT family N-acetyltransferase [Jidongwangia harbinensis]MCA2214377.1 GNAT family N-acetyltransferase [Jidongwangia harbinensis]
MGTSTTAIDSIHDLQPQLANCRAYWLGWGSADDVHADLPVYRSVVPRPLLNGVLRLRGRRVAQVLPEVRERLAGTPWLWWAGADSDPAVGDDLRAEGATEVQTLPVMALSLDRIPETPLPAGTRIDRVTDAADITAYVEAYAPPLGVTGTAVAATVEGELHRSARYDDLLRFAARIDGRVVGTAAVSISNGVAGIYVVATDARYRRRGIGAAVTGAALRAARYRGLRVATLQASPAGEPVYRRLGFRTVGSYRLFRF